MNPVSCENNEVMRMGLPWIKMGRDSVQVGRTLFSSVGEKGCVPQEHGNSMTILATPGDRSNKASRRRRHPHCEDPYVKTTSLTKEDPQQLEKEREAERWRKH